MIGTEEEPGTPCANDIPSPQRSRSGLDWFPTFLAAAGNPTITEDLLKGVKLGNRTYKNHLDGYNQMDLITGKGPSARHESLYCAESTLGAVRGDDFKYRFIDQLADWRNHQAGLAWWRSPGSR